MNAQAAPATAADIAGSRRGCRAGGARARGATDHRWLGSGARRRTRDGRGMGHRRTGSQPGAGRMRGARYGSRQRRRQDRQEPAQDHGPAARPCRREDGRRDRRGSRPRADRDRAAGRRRRRHHAVDQSGRDPCQQHRQRAQVPQRDRAGAVAQGCIDADAVAAVRARGIRSHRRAARSRPRVAGAVRRASTRGN